MVEDTSSNDSDGTEMDDRLRARREETWDLLVVKGLDYGKVVSRLASQYDTTKAAIEKDIERMDNWLPKLDPVSQKTGVSRVRELRQNRQRLQQMAMEARNEGDLEKELKIRRRIDRAVKLDVELSQSLGLTEREAEEVEVSWREYIKAADSDDPVSADELPDRDE